MGSARLFQLIAYNSLIENVVADTLLAPRRNKPIDMLQSLLSPSI
jgi:hypothetical protein